MPTLETFEYPGDTTKPLQTCVSKLGRRWIHWTGAEWSPQQFSSHHTERTAETKRWQSHNCGEGSVPKWDWRHFRDQGTGATRKASGRNQQETSLWEAELSHSTCSHQIYSIILPKPLWNPSLPPPPNLSSLPHHCPRQWLPPPSDPHYTNSELSKPHVWMWHHCEVL